MGSRSLDKLLITVTVVFFKYNNYFINHSNEFDIAGIMDFIHRDMWCMFYDRIFSISIIAGWIAEVFFMLFFAYIAV